VKFANPAARRLREAIAEGPAAVRASWDALAASAARVARPTTFEAEFAGAGYLVTAVPLPSLGYVNVYAADVTERTIGERRLRAQLARNVLLHRITRAIGERLDLRVVLQVVCDSIQSQLFARFCAIALLEGMPARPVVRCIAARSAALAEMLGLVEGASPDLGEKGLERFASGRPVFDPRAAESPGDEFSRRLVAGGMQSIVLVPLHVEGHLSGLLVVARTEAAAFDGDECEFLGQLGENVALAVQQAQLHGTLRQAYEELIRTQRTIVRQEGLRALGQMAGGIVHDVNNAIAPVALYTEALLEGEPGLSARAREYLGTIQGAVDSVAATVERLRQFHRPREEDFGRTKVTLDPLLGKVAELARAQLSSGPGPAVDVELRLDPAVPAIEASEAEIQEALMNLVMNARDAMPEGGCIVLRARPAASPDGAPLAIVEVADTGVGMDDVTCRRCLEPFFTTKGRRGSGLGLPMVYGAMQRHGGDMEIQSAPGAGTTVRLQFPAMSPETRTAAVAPSQPHPRVGGPLRVLLVDDDPMVVRSLVKMIELDGHDIDSASGGAEAIAAFEAALRDGRPYDAVITDLGMPGCDGHAVARAVKAARPDARVIVLTGWGERMGESDAAACADLVLGKPPRLAQIRDALEHCRAIGGAAGGSA
jgi:signal transduction histidine kinase/ActR/RegA family two-component response regulator